MKKGRSKVKLAELKIENDIITFSSEGKILSDKFISEVKEVGKTQVIDLQDFLAHTDFLDNLNFVATIIYYSVNYVSALNKHEKAQGEKVIEEMMGIMFHKFEYSKLQEHRIARDYKIKKTSNPKEFIYTIPSLNPNFRLCTLKGESVDDNNTFNKIKALEQVAFASVMSNKIGTNTEVVKILLKDAKNTLTLSLARNNKIYQEALIVIISAVQSLEPKFHLELVVFLKEHLKENINGLSFASKILMDNQRYEEAIELLEPKLINITKSNHEIALCAYNLATSYMKIYNYEKAEKYLLEAFKELPNDENVITQLFDIYLLTHRVEDAKNLLNNLLSENTRNFCMLPLSATKLNKEALKCVDKSKLSPFFSNAYKYYEYIAKYNDLSDTEKHKNASGLESQLKNIIKSTDNNQYLALTTALYTQQKQIVLDVLKDIPTSFMKVYPNLWLLESIFNPAAVIKKYENYDYNLLTKADLHCLNMAYSCLIAEGKNEVVSKNIQKALDSEHNDQNTVEIAFTSALLDNDKEKAKEYINQLNKETQEEVISNYRSSDTQIDNLEQLIELYDAKKIHEYYQAKKQQELLLIKQDMLNVPAACWKLSDGETVTTEDAKFIGKYKGKNCYGIISEKLENKLGSNFDRFKKALEEKGLIYRKFGENGIKFIKNIFEIKIDSDDRVYTNQVYTNENEELLLNFEDYGNHKVVKQLIIGNHSLEFHSDLPSQ